ncbi:MAG: hypothetical protein V4440_03815, partial [Pseudomonadota bacterium]
MAINLPQGFVLDQPTQQQSPNLPEGFVLDKPAADSGIFTDPADVQRSFETAHPIMAGAEKVANGILNPIAQTFFGKSLNDTAMNNAGSGISMSPQEAEAYKQKWGTNPDFYKADPSNPMVKAGLYADKALSGMVGSAADMATTPSNFAPIPAVEAVGKIPVGATNVGRLASNVEIRSPFNPVGRDLMGQDVKQIQAMDAKLGNIETSASGKAIDTSSRGTLPLSDYANNIIKSVANEGINRAIRPSVSGKNVSFSQREKFENGAAAAVKDMVQNQNQHEFTDLEGNVKDNKLPQDIRDTAQALQQGLSRVY